MPQRFLGLKVCLGALFLGSVVFGGNPAHAQSFVNWESPHVHPLDLTPSGNTLVAVNTPDARLEIYQTTDWGLVALGNVPVGLDPVSVRVRGEYEAWVVNHVSDTISIVDLERMQVVMTLKTPDEPADVVFVESQQRAFVTCAQPSLLMVFDLNDLMAPPTEIQLQGEEPKALAVSADGSQVYVAIFESGNGTTVLGGGLNMGGGGFPPNVVSNAQGPYGGQNPPPNLGATFAPPINPLLPAPPPVSLIVRHDPNNGVWFDDNGGDWTSLVSGPRANLSGRPVGWTLLDHDMAVVDTSTLAVDYVGGALNLNMALGVNPVTGQVMVVGTDALNQIRFEPNLNARFLRVDAVIVDPDALAITNVTDLNPHLTYPPGPNFVPIPMSQRLLSLGDPRAIAWDPNGTIAYVAGMGSNNIIVVDTTGARIGAGQPINVGEGPTGLIYDDARARLYVLNKFAGSIGIVDPVAAQMTQEFTFYDPSPAAIRIGRKHLYDTHLTSGTGHVACASCHVDARTDRSVWDLGDPGAEMKAFNQNCLDGACTDWHPMKGPMLTQTLRDIVGLEPHHWRGDREGLEAFANAFVTIIGDDQPIPPPQMQEFEDFLATIYFPPNPFRNFDNSLPTDLPLPGHFTTGEFASAGQPLPNGNAEAGLLNYRTGNLDLVQCVTCHSLPTGAGANGILTAEGMTEIPPGPLGESHLLSVSIDGFTNRSLKVPHLRNLYRRVGFNMTQGVNTIGIGYAHDGSIDSIERFISEPVFSLANVQEVADMVAFQLAFSGSDLPEGTLDNNLEPLGVASQDTHAAVGAQTTLVEAASMPQPQRDLIDAMLSLADAGAVDVVVKGVVNGEQRGYAYLGGGMFQSDRLAQSVSAAALELLATPDGELTYMVVPHGAATRVGIDRDEDTFFDRDELDVCSDPANPQSLPGAAQVAGDYDDDGDVDKADFAAFAGCELGPDLLVGVQCLCPFDVDSDQAISAGDFADFQTAFTGAN